MKNGLVLGGGGARGAYQIGVWRALREEAWPFHIVCGTSVGALNAALIAQGDYDLAAEIWGSLYTGAILSMELDEEDAEYKKMFQAFHTYLKGGVSFTGAAGLDTAGLKKLMAAHLDEAKIRSSGLEMGLVTVAWKDGPALVPHQLYLRDIPEGRLIDYMMGSASLYPAMKYYDIDGERYIDGGYHDKLPVGMAFAAGADFVLAVDINGPGRLHEVELEPGKELQVLASFWPLGPMLLFENRWIRKDMALGYLDGKKAFGHYSGCYFTFRKPGFGAVAARVGDLQAVRRHLGRESGYGSFYQNSFDRWVRRKYQGRYHWRRDLPAILAEAAGEVFLANPTAVYDDASFLAEMRQKALEAAGNREGAPTGGLEKGGLPLGHQNRALHFARGLRAGGEGRAFTTAVNMSVREYLAGAFLYLYGLIPAEEGKGEKPIKIG